MKKFSICLIAILCSAIFNSSFSLASTSLPKNLHWLTNDQDPVYSSPNASKGGTLRNMLESFPLTLRYVGPDSNGSFRSAILGNHMALVEEHPNTFNLIPSLATHWAYSDDNTTMYFKLNPNAKWSDGQPVKASDYAFTLEFMRSKDIVAPWYNTYYKDQIKEVIIYDEHTISVSTNQPKPRDELHSHISISPTPKHFYGDLSGFVRKFNWKIAPNTGAYQISNIKKGKSITFSRKKNWWAKDLKYFKNRFNVDRVKYSVIRDLNIGWEYFLKGNLDFFSITLPLYWHQKATGPEFDNGYIHKLWFYTDAPMPSVGLWLNQDKTIFKDINVRLGLAHAFNIEKVNQQVLRGDYTRKHSIHSGFGKYTNLNIKAREYDLNKANNYFNKAGWKQRGDDGIRIKDGQRLSIAVTYGHEAHTPRLVVLKEEYKKAGVELVLRKVDSAASFKSVLEKKHDVWWGGLIGGRKPQYWGQFHSENAHKLQTNNFTNTDDAKIDSMIDAYRSAMNIEERIKLAHALQQRIHDLGAWIPRLDTPYSRIAYWRWVKFPDVPGTRIGGPSVSAFDLAQGGLFWIDTKQKKTTLTARKKGKTFTPVTRIDETYRVNTQ